MNTLNLVESNSGLKNAVIYVRCCNDGDLDNAIKTQIDGCTAFALFRGYKITHIYCDNNVSGRTENRPEFQKMIADTHTGAFQAVFVWNLSRFARNLGILSKHNEILNKNGVHLISVDEMSDNTPMTQFIKNMITA